LWLHAAAQQHESCWVHVDTQLTLLQPINASAVMPAY
jgi:hypothetical protein